MLMRFHECLLFGLFALPLSGHHFLCTRLDAGAWGGVVCFNRLMRWASSAPVRGGTHFLCCCKESKQRKQLPTAKANNRPLAFDWDWPWRVSVALTVEPGLARGPTASTRTSSEWYALRLAPSSLRSDVGHAWRSHGGSQKPSFACAPLALIPCALPDAPRV